MEHPSLTINGVPRGLAGAGAHTTLLDHLRGLGLTGAKEGCAEGECGACAVLVARPDGLGGTRLESVNACLVPVAALDGGEVVTAEGLGTPQRPHEVQRELAVRGGSQCGYCTPGFVLSMAAEFYRPERQGGQHGAPNGFDAHALSGNLCRCTGYRPIVDAAHALGAPQDGDAIAARLSAPPPAPRPTVFRASDGEFRRPASLTEALDLLAQHPDARVLAGGTDWGVEVNLRHARAARTVAVDALPELRVLEWGPDSLLIGAALNLSELERGLGGRVPLLSALLPQFASRLIRNSATLGGNLGTASPIGDALPALLALGAEVVLVSAQGERAVALDGYFTGYRQTARRPGELIRAVRVPLPLSPLTAFHKIAKRRYDDISAVSVAYALEVAGGHVRRARIGLGGVAATPLRAHEAEAALEGQPWTLSTVGQAARVLGRAGTPLSDVRASAAYRAAMLEQSLLRLWHEHGEEVGRAAD